MVRFMVAICWMACSQQLLADNVAVLTRASGDVKLLKNPSDVVRGEGPHVRFDQKYYIEFLAKRGAKLDNGEVIQVHDGGQARLIFRNGDVITVDGGTSYRVAWSGDSAPVFDLLFGRMRAIFKKDGPRSGARVRTRSTVMGVRGTDFFATFKGSAQLAVLRGKVELKENKPKAKPVTVESGFSAKVPASTSRSKQKKRSSSTIQVQKTTKEELVVIQKATKLVAAKAPSKSSDAVLEAQLKQLEAQATKNVIEDIKETDPILYQEIAKPGKNLDIDQVATAAVGQLFKEAPEAAKNLKPFGEALESLGEDSYDKYFRDDY